MVDLHTHSSYSDGTYSVRELLQEAEKVGVTYLSITDHDKVNSYFDMKEFNVKDYYTGKIMTGCEFSVSFDGKRIEFLGYGFDINKVKEWLDVEFDKKKIIEYNIMEFNEIYEMCINKGIKMTPNLEYNPTDYAVDIIYYDVTKYECNKKFFTDEEWNNIDVFWRKCSNNQDFILYWDFSKRIPKAEIVSNLIRENGGKVFIAHIFKYQIENHIELLDKLKNQNLIDGVETYYSAFNDEQVEYLKKYCKDNNLLMSGGTDFHGMKKKDRKIGIGYGNMNISDNVVSDWFKEYKI